MDVSKPNTCMSCRREEPAPGAWRDYATLDAPDGRNFYCGITYRKLCPECAGHVVGCKIHCTTGETKRAGGDSRNGWLDRRRHSCIVCGTRGYFRDYVELIWPNNNAKMESDWQRRTVCPDHANKHSVVTLTVSGVRQAAPRGSRPQYDDFDPIEYL